MRQRCNDPNSISYKYYGARGIKVMWESYEDFKRDMGDSYAPGLKIERINNNGHYCKENCCWKTDAEQCRNRRNNVFLEYNGERKCMTDWAHSLGMAPKTMGARIRSGWTAEEAITTPVKS